MFNPKAYINLNHLRSNISYLRSISNNAELFPVIKADAYGHGSLRIAEELVKMNISTVCVATYLEIKELIESKISIDVLHLGKISYAKFDIYFNQNVIVTVNSIEDVDKICLLTKDKNKSIRCYIKLDTGMNRMGCKEEEFDTIYKKIITNDLISLEGIYSHLSSSNNIESPSNKKQFKMFLKIINTLKNSSLKFHILNSAGIFNFNEFSLSAVRPGLSIYGISPICINNNLKPIMKLKAPIVHLKKVLNGESIGYDCKYLAEDDINIAIIQCGYADGLSKDFENNGLVFFRKKKYSIIGKISMDLFAIDCKEDTFQINDEVTIWGGNSSNSQLESISEKYSSIPYVYLTNLSKRIERVYV